MLNSGAEAEKSELLEKAADVARHARGTGGPPPGSVLELLTAYYGFVAPEDLLERSAGDVYGAFDSHHRFAGHRQPGHALVRVFTPTLGEHEWSAGGHSVVEVVTDDMPFLVASLTMALSRQDREVHLVIHPSYDVRRDDDGTLTELQPVNDGSAEPVEGMIRESWMHLEITRLSATENPDALVAVLERVLKDVRQATEDWRKMEAQVGTIFAELAESPPPLDPDELRSAQELLEWLADEHFTFLGYREYRLEHRGGEDVLTVVPGSGLGILRDEQRTSGSFSRLPVPSRARAREKKLLVLAKANSRATVHRPAYLDYVGVRVFDDDGEVVGEKRFLGLFSSSAYTESLMRIPLIRDKAEEVLRRSGFDPRSHAGNVLMDTLESYPRDELFHTEVDELTPLVMAAMRARERRRLRVFARRDTYGRYVSVLVYLPRDRYNTTVRERFVDILKDRLGGDEVEFTVRIDEATTARVHFVVRMAREDIARGEELPEVEIPDLERRLTEASRSWREDLGAAVLAEFGEESGADLGRRYVAAFPEGYKEDFPARVAAVDIARLERLFASGRDEAIDLNLHEPLSAAEGEAELKIFRVGPPLTLSWMLPMLSSMGVTVIEERPYTLEGLSRPSTIYVFEIRNERPLPDEARDLFTDALRAVWEGHAEIDGFNGLVLDAGLAAEQITVLRAYAKYMRQGGSPFSQESIEGALRAHVKITRTLVELFETRFDPARFADDEDGRAARAEQTELLSDQITTLLGDVPSLDHDRILRSYLTHIRATQRTNHYRTERPEGLLPVLSLKLEPSAIPELPEPRPAYEIFVYSPRVEGVHLRFGPVARGGLRWSDRRDDFRTEVLGLVKAQQVKNTVIVPVGAKGGFYAKELPDPAVDREGWLKEGKACYRGFISGLLDVTDNRGKDGVVVPPPDVVRHDGDDHYLVVAADKGTASFSDIANAVAVDYGFWLGDAFASGGSVGYDHKEMGITAKGAWVSVQRHFREMGHDVQAEDFTVVGIGDMSGDVFGNGMLCSPHIRLVAAFDHRDIFIDPDPDPEASYAERRRLFEMGRSTWADYETGMISAGGGVFSRSMKSIPLSPEIRDALDIDDGIATMTPNELMRAILLAPVDLLWNGGIGTYVKSSRESDADAGDKANDAIRVNGRDLRVRAVGEGGNLGFTQAGRIEYARFGCGGEGGRINTDFIDNSAGVDTSDHEVNIKILLDRAVDAGDLTRKQRNSLLAEMTDEVADLVLEDNYEQNLALANAITNAPSLLHVHQELMNHLEEAKPDFDRELEELPGKEEIEQRMDRGEGLTTPELSVLLSWAKIVLTENLTASSLADEEYLEGELTTYFPSAMRDRFAEQIAEHPLRREIITTRVVGEVINGSGITFLLRLAAETGADAVELTRANLVAREIFGANAVHEEISTFDNRLPASVQNRMRIEMRTLVERASRWLVTRRRPPLDLAGTHDYFAEPVGQVMAALPDLLTGREQQAVQERRERLVDQGVPEDLATRIAVLPPAYSLLGVVETAIREGLDAPTVARVHFALGERLGLSTLLQRIVTLPRSDRWQTMARAALRDDLHGVHTQLTAQVLRTTDPDDPAPVRVATWEDAEHLLVDRAAETLEQICADEEVDLARMSVGLRVVRGLLG